MIDKPYQKKKVQNRCIYLKDEKMCVIMYSTSFTLHCHNNEKLLNIKNISFYRKYIIINWASMRLTKNSQKDASLV